MDYKYITADDKFIDDVNNKRYNTWVSGSTNAKSYESMLIKPYTFGAVINYNMNPTIAGAGSAIFIHLWRSPNSPTTGCIALDKKHLLMMLHWLDKTQHPYVLVQDKQIKSELVLTQPTVSKWRRQWKINLIEQNNPRWTNLAIGLF